MVRSSLRHVSALRRPALWGAVTLGALACGPAELSLGDGDDDTPVADDVADTPSVEEDSDAGADDTAVVDTATGDDPVEDTGPDLSIYDGATLVVLEPVSNGIYTSSGMLPMQAEVLDAQGDPLPFTDVTWTLDDATAPVFTGLDGAPVVDLGIYTVTATAALPNGSVLSSTLGGVRVQHPRAGVYVGSIALTTISEVQGQEIRSDCVGALEFEVPLDGQTLEGSGGCTLAIPLVGTTDLDFTLDGGIANPGVAGDVNFSTGLIDLPVGWGGVFQGPDTLSGGFSSNLFLFELLGEINGTRVTSYVDP